MRAVPEWSPGDRRGTSRRTLLTLRLASRNKKPWNFQGLSEAADGTRTHDLLHGNRLRFPHKRWLERFSAESDARRLPGIPPISVPQWSPGIYRPPRGGTGRGPRPGREDARLSGGSGHAFTVETDARNSSVASVSRTTAGALARCRGSGSQTGFAESGGIEKSVTGNQAADTARSCVPLRVVHVRSAIRSMLGVAIGPP
jgi:hypothetical protein